MVRRRIRLSTGAAPRSLSLCLAVAAACAPQPLEAQDPGFFHGRWGLALQVAQPVGVFADVIDTGWGLGGHLALFGGDGPWSLRLDAGFVEYGRVTQRVCLSPTVGCRIQVDLVTSNNIVPVSIGPQLMLPRAPVRPYVTAGVGFSWFSTESRVEDVDGFSQGVFSTNNFSDLTLAASVAGGVTIRLTRGRTPVSLDLGARYHRNGEAEYLTEDDIVDEPDGSITVLPNRSEANLVTFHLGVSVGIPMGDPG